MQPYLYEIDRMTRRDHRNFIRNQGGKLGFWKGIQRGGTGVGGLSLPVEKNEWWSFKEEAVVAASPEIMNEVLMLRFNNTKRIIAMPIPFTSIQSIELLKVLNSESGREEIRISIHWNGGPDVILENRGWNNRTAIQFFTKKPLDGYLKIS